MKDTIIVILFWIVFWIAFWLYNSYNLLYNNYIINQNNIIKVKQKIKNKQQEIIKNIENMIKSNKITIKEIKNIEKTVKYNKKIFIIINIKDKEEIAKQLNNWFIYWKTKRINNIWNKIAWFIKNDFQVSYIINWKKNIKLNCILKTNNLNIKKIKDSYKNSSYYCSDSINNNYKIKFPYLFNKKYININSYIIITKEKLDKKISLWNNSQEILNIIKNY